MKLVEAAAVLLVVVVVAPTVRGLWVDLPSTGTKCVSEELHNSVVVLADFHSFFGQNDDVNHTVSPSISVKHAGIKMNELDTEALDEIVELLNALLR